MEQFALCDVVMTQIKVSGGTTHSFATADEISCEPVIEEGETKNLTIKNKLIASFMDSSSSGETLLILIG